MISQTSSWKQIRKRRNCRQNQTSHNRRNNALVINSILIIMFSTLLRLDRVARNNVLLCVVVIIVDIIACEPACEQGVLSNCVLVMLCAFGPKLWFPRALVGPNRGSTPNGLISLSGDQLHTRIWLLSWCSQQLHARRGADEPKWTITALP